MNFISEADGLKVPMNPSTIDRYVEYRFAGMTPKESKAEVWKWITGYSSQYYLLDSTAYCRLIGQGTSLCTSRYTLIQRYLMMYYNQYYSDASTDVAEDEN